MDFIAVEKRDGIATITLARGNVNALNNQVVDEIRETLKSLETDPETNAVILTGRGKFFSFGFDIPEFLSFTREEFSDYLVNFTSLNAYLFLYPKPVVAALNGHTIAGGCMVALACDRRVMADGKGKISLNEIALGSSVMAGSTEMLRFWCGSANATQILYSGEMYSAEAALGLGLVQEVAVEADLISRARNVAADLASKHPAAFASIKSLLRKPMADDFMRRERTAIKEFVDIWYSEATWTNLRNVKIN